MKERAEVFITQCFKVKPKRGISSLSFLGDQIENVEIDEQLKSFFMFLNLFWIVSIPKTLFLKKYIEEDL